MSSQADRSCTVDGSAVHIQAQSNSAELHIRQQRTKLPQRSFTIVAGAACESKLESTKSFPSRILPTRQCMCRRAKTASACASVAPKPWQHRLIVYFTRSSSPPVRRLNSGSRAPASSPKNPGPTLRQSHFGSLVQGDGTDA